MPRRFLLGEPVVNLLIRTQLLHRIADAFCVALKGKEALRPYRVWLRELEDLHDRHKFDLDLRKQLVTRIGVRKSIGLECLETLKADNNQNDRRLGLHSEHSANLSDCLASSKGRVLSHPRRALGNISGPLARVRVEFQRT